MRRHDAGDLPAAMTFERLGPRDHGEFIVTPDDDQLDRRRGQCFADDAARLGSRDARHIDGTGFGGDFGTEAMLLALLQLSGGGGPQFEATSTVKPAEVLGCKPVFSRSDLARYLAAKTRARLHRRIGAVDMTVEPVWSVVVRTCLHSGFGQHLKARCRLRFAAQPIGNDAHNSLAGGYIFWL